MTEYNTFCWSKQYNDDQSCQQKRYRVFNKEVGQDRYYTVLDFIRSIIPNKTLKLPEFWKTITPHQIMELSKIPEFDKEGFEYITGLKVPDNNFSGKKVKVDIDGFTYTATID
jgi:hypothetical protein